MAATVPTWADLVFIGKWDIPWIYLAGWWFQTWLVFFPFHIWNVILPAH